MHLDEDDKDEENYVGIDYQDYDEKQKQEWANPSYTGKNETVANNPGKKSLLGIIYEKEQYHPQTELKLNEKKIKEKFEIRKNSISGNSTKDLKNGILKKKTSRCVDEIPKKKPKAKSDMDLTYKNKTEINREVNHTVYDKFNLEPFYNDLFEEKPPSGDLFDAMNNDDPNAEVNQIKPEYKSQINPSLPESLNMIISSNF